MHEPAETNQSGFGPAPAILDPVDICTLPPSGLAERLEWVEREIMPDAIGRRRLEDGLAIEFAASPGARARLEQWVALERKCCDGLGWVLSEEGAGDAQSESGFLRLEIRGVDPDGLRFRGLPLLDEELDGALPPGFRPGAGRRRISRILAAGGVGGLVGFLVCCLLPAWLVPVLGATLAGAALAGLDDPRWIALAAFVGGALTYGWLSRRERSAGCAR